MSADDRFCFIVEWYDPNAALIRRYQFLYYPRDCTIEMYDLKNHRSFLRRTKAETVRVSDLYIGSTVNILSRQLQFVDYGDEFTRQRLGSKKERTLAIIKPDAIAQTGPILDTIARSDLVITRMRKCQFSRDDAFEFYSEHQSKPFFNKLIGFMTSGPIIAMELMGEGAVSKWRSLIGPTDSSNARTEDPMSIRARFGTDNTQNACHGADSAVSAARELELLFPSSGAGPKGTATFSNCTCCVIKPHSIKGGFMGKIVERIQEMGFEISALEMFHLEKANAEEFFEVYKGVVQEYPSMVEELIAGPCVALEIRAQDAPRTFREAVGPSDPEIARQLRPRTIRSMFGKDKIQNAVHCTDLAEDALLEVEYFFKILSN